MKRLGEAVGVKSKPSKIVNGSVLWFTATLYLIYFTFL